MKLHGSSLNLLIFLILTSAQHAPVVKSRLLTQSSVIHPGRNLIALQRSTQSFKCTCESCTDQALIVKAGNFTCGERILYLQEASSHLYPSEEAACKRIANIEFPLECQPCNPVTCNNPTVPSYYCSCPSCTVSIWSTMANGHTCGSRIQWIQTQEGLTEESACRRVSNEFPSICGPSCNPDVCSTVPVVPVAPFTPPPPVPSSPPAPYTGDTNLYCFPDGDARKRYTNVWKKYIVEVKESMEICGPGNNRFSQQTVALSTSKDELTLQYKQLSGSWMGSEVRVLLPPEQMPFTYGTFSFSVKSITVRNRMTNVVSLSNDLPPSLILGLFTWDPTEDYSSHENYNHEVDIEISRWNVTSAPDAQFLVQPPGSPQMKRFYTGAGSGQRSPGGHTYQFTWNPGEVFWYTTAGGGQSHSYSTLQTITDNVPDYVQCLPSNTEIRLNLWSMHGTIETPTNLGQNDIVEVIIDKFSFIPSGLDGLENNKKCTKDCQCKKPSKCINKVCTLEQ